MADHTQNPASSPANPRHWHAAVVLPGAIGGLGLVLAVIGVAQAGLAGAGRWVLPGGVALLALAAGLLAWRACGEPAHRILAGVGNGQLVAGCGKTARHRRAHVAETDEADALGRGETTSHARR